MSECLLSQRHEMIILHDGRLVNIKIDGPGALCFKGFCADGLGEGRKQDPQSTESNLDAWIEGPPTGQGRNQEINHEGLFDHEL